MSTIKDHAELAEEFNKDEERVDWHDETLWWIRQKRDKATHGIAEWEALRETASQIKIMYWVTCLSTWCNLKRSY
jgi:L-lactate dehydrogenase complex protein LldF